MSEKKEITSPVKAIRAFCLDCLGGSWYEVKNCSAPDCALYPFRFGKNPFRTPRQLTDEQKAAATERLRKSRESNPPENSQ